MNDKNWHGDDLLQSSSDSVKNPREQVYKRVSTCGGGDVKQSKERNMKEIDRRVHRNFL